MSQTFHPGQAVTDADGDVGVITEPVRKSGPNKGRVAVMWVGGDYELSAWPEDLTPITITAFTPHLIEGTNAAE